MVTRSLWVTAKNDHRWEGGVNRPFHCACCTPPRQIYYRLERPVDRAFHEANPERPHELDHTPATAAASLASQRRELGRRRAARKR